MRRLSKQFPIVKMSKIFGVSRSGYYRFLKEHQGKREQEEAELLKEITRIFYDHKKRYGSPRVYEELKTIGIQCSKNKVAKIMKTNKLVAKTPKKWKGKKLSGKEKKPNLLKRNFSAEIPNNKWVSDITYVQTAKGWVYLCAIMDLFSRKIVGHAVEGHMKKELVIKALQQAVSRRGTEKTKVIFHSDQGVQYGANELNKYMEKLGFVGSMSGKGSCFDNAAMESFFSSYKRECVHKQTYESLEVAQKETFNYIECYYNSKRKHSTLGYLSPNEFEKKHENSLC